MSKKNNEKFTEVTYIRSKDYNHYNYERLNNVKYLLVEEPIEREKRIK